MTRHCLPSSIAHPARLRGRREARLLQRMSAAQRELRSLLVECSDHWGYEDPVYRFYHQSFKLYRLQQTTGRIVKALRSLAPRRPLNPYFEEILRAGAGKTFSPADNARWTAVTRSIVEAFFHARFFLEMACRYGRRLRKPPQFLPSGWAALLYFYNLR